MSPSPLSWAFKRGEATPKPRGGPRGRGQGRGSPRIRHHLKCRHLSAFALTLHSMSGSFAKLSDEAVDAQCEKLIQEGAFHAALALLMETYGTSIYAFCCKMLRDASTAADILQVTFVQAFRGLPHFEKKVSFHMWLLTIARNRAMDHLRIARRIEKASVRLDEMEEEGEVALEDVAPLADQLIERQHTLRLLEQCLRELRAQTLDVGIIRTLLLRFREQLSYERISEMLGTPKGTLRVRVLRTLPKLKQCLESKGGERRE